jgi:WD40 repeat protein
VAGVERARLPGQRGVVTGLVFAPDGSALTAIAADGTLKRWEAAPAAERVAISASRVLALSADARTAVVCEREAVNGVGFEGRGSVTLSERPGAVKVWDLTNGEVRAVLRLPPKLLVHSAVLSPDGRTLAVGGGRDVHLCDAATGQERRRLLAHSGVVHAVAFSPDGGTLASASADRTVILWDLARGEDRAVLLGHEAPVRDVVFTPDGRRLVSAGDDQTIRLWDAATGGERGAWAANVDSRFRVLVGALAVSPDGRTLGTAAVRQRVDPSKVPSEYPSASEVTLWDLATGQARVTFGRDHGAVNAVAFSPDGRLLATGGDDATVRLWDAATGQERGRYAGHRGRVLSVAFARDGRAVASASWSVSGETFLSNRWKGAVRMHSVIGDR